MTETELDELKNQWFHHGWTAALQEVVYVQESPNWESGYEFARAWLRDHGDDNE
jgi:hypothetical protein